ncbi:MAG: hypothetical protein AB7P78_19095 [Candidatus Binatia bacterium]
MNRREFLGTGATFALLLVLPWKSQAATAPGSVEVVAETSRPEALAFAAAFRARGVQTRETGADASALIEEVAASLARRRTALVGFTGTASALLFEAVANDRGLVLTYRGRHERAAGGSLRHVLEGDAHTVQRLASGFSHAESAWSGAFERELAGLVVSPRAPTRVAVDLPTAGASCARGPVVSWAFAPWRDA